MKYVIPAKAGIHGMDRMDPGPSHNWRRGDVWGLS